jgi:putative ABC transport system substrate-binding protein
MRRRTFITLLGSAAAWPAVMRAQPAKRPPTIGFIGVNAAAWRPWTAAFVDRLRELGWVEGRTIAIEYRWDEGIGVHDREIAAELVRLKTHVIVAVGTAVPAVMQATSTIPIVFPLADDPVGHGLAESLARPGGNVTGLSLQQIDLAGKRMGLLHDVVPQLRKLAVMFDAGYSSAMQEMGEVLSAARTLDIEVTALEIRREEDIATAFASLKGGADGLYVVIDPLVNIHRAHIIELTLAARLPMIFGTRDYARDGGLMSYGPNLPDLFRRAAEFVDKILAGAKPANIPIEQPVKFDLVINLKAAKTLGLNVPQGLLASADEVIE